VAPNTVVLVDDGSQATSSLATPAPTPASTSGKRKHVKTKNGSTTNPGKKQKTTGGVWEHFSEIGAGLFVFSCTLS
jgi:hypothetical protein